MNVPATTDNVNELMSELVCLCNTVPVITPIGPTILNNVKYLIMLDTGMPDLTNATNTATDSAGWCKPIDSVRRDRSFLDDVRPRARVSRTSTISDCDA